MQVERKKEKIIFFSYFALDNDQPFSYVFSFTMEN